jgi:hypothetical protein
MLAPTDAVMLYGYFPVSMLIFITYIGLNVWTLHMRLLYQIV